MRSPRQPDHGRFLWASSGVIVAQYPASVHAARHPVELRRLSGTDLAVSEICLGTMTFGNRVDEATASEIMDLAYAAGVRFFDTADVYPPPGTPEVRGRSEEILGSWLKRRGLRADVVLATKVGKPMGGSDVAGLSRAAILRACDESLRRLQTSWIDLYLAHVPDWATPLDETLATLYELMQSGKVRSIGCSNFPPAELVHWLSAAESVGMTSAGAYQQRYNLLTREVERQTMPLCALYGVGVIAHSPLAGGLLTDRSTANQPATAPAARLRRLAVEHGRSLTRVALSWTLSRPGIASVVLGVSCSEQLRDNLGGVGLKLDEGLVEAIEETLADSPEGTQEGSAC
jgi:aryl-alcohol dehydrogenase (NADP+)